MEQLLNGEQNMKSAVFFPGIGYHCDKPLLYYSRKLAQECGYEETIALSYTYDGGNIRGNEARLTLNPQPPEPKLHYGQPRNQPRKEILRPRQRRHL